MVSAGEWRDYGMSFLKDVAIFSIFRRTAEHPIYRIEKRPKLRGKQGMYSVIAMDGQILKRGHDLKTVLRVLERKLIRHRVKFGLNRDVTGPVSVAAMRASARAIGSSTTAM